MRICASATSDGAHSGEWGKVTLLKIVIAVGLFRCFILLINYENYLQGVQVKSEAFISSMVFIPLVVRGCKIHFIIQKGWKNNAQLKKL